MDSNVLKRGYKEASKKLDDQQVEAVKSLVLAAQEVLLRKQAEHRALTKHIQLLKKDLEDVRNGRVDQIVERHEKDATANDVSPINPQMLDRAMKGEVIPPLPKTTEKEIVTHIHHHWYNYWGWQFVPPVITIATPVVMPSITWGDNTTQTSLCTLNSTNFTMTPNGNTYTTTGVCVPVAGGNPVGTFVVSGNSQSIAQASTGTYLLSTGDVKYL